MTEITENEKMVTTPCKHVFHKRCIDKWKQRSDTAPKCPNCRAVIGKAPRYLYQERQWYAEERQKIEREQRRLCGRMRVLGMQLEYPEEFEEEQWDEGTRREMRKKMDKYERQAEALQDDLRALRNALCIIRNNRLRQ